MNKYKISTENEAWDTSLDGEVFDKVTNPKHYKGSYGLEVIEVHYALIRLIDEYNSQFEEENE